MIATSSASLDSNRRERRALLYALLASLAAHAAIVAFVTLPIGAEKPTPQVLEVVIAEAPRPLPVVEEPKKKMAPPKRERERPRHIEEKKIPRAEEPRPAESQPPVLALPIETPAPPVFTVPQAPADARPGPPEPKVAVKPRDSGAAEGISTTPANFNAAYLKNEPPRYPLSARRSGIEGRVNLKVLVTRDGRAAQVLVHETSGSSVLDAAAVDAVRNWQFVPARRGQEPIESSVIVPIVFKLEKAG